MSNGIPIQKATLERNLTHDLWDVLIMAGRGGAAGHNSIDIVQPLAPCVIKHYAPGEVIDRVPAFQLAPDSAQALMDAMWNAGIRPTTSTDEGASLSAVIKAKDAHIADLQRMAFPTLHPDTPRSGTPSF